MVMESCHRFLVHFSKAPCSIPIAQVSPTKLLSANDQRRTRRRGEEEKGKPMMGGKPVVGGRPLVGFCSSVSLFCCRQRRRKFQGKGEKETRREGRGERKIIIII